VDVALSRRRVAVAILVVLGWAAAAHAEDATLPPANVVGLAGAYALYARAAVFSLPFVLALVRETRGKTLEQM